MGPKTQVGAENYIMRSFFISFVPFTNYFFLFPWRNSPPGGQGLLIVEDS
jgi:hypothetical protein